MKKKSIILAFLFLFIIERNYSQIGVGTTTPASTLDVVATNPTGTTINVDGILIPRVTRERAQSMTGTATSTMIYINEVVTGTATGTTLNVTSTGFYFFNGTLWEKLTTGLNNNWTLTGNSGTNGGNITTAGTNFLGTTDAQNIDFRTNNIFRGRFSSLGEFFVGTYNTSMPGDLCNSVGNASFPWALNGYTDQAGGGTYGSITGGSSAFGSVQGEYYGTSAYGSGVRGISSTTSSGANFKTSVSACVDAYYIVPSSRNYAFGVFGSVGNNSYVASNRSGGVLGTDLFASGGLGYYAANGNDYSVYGFGQGHTTGGTTGKIAQDLNSLNTLIGIGIYGGVIGGWIKGDEYGTVFSGKQFGNYTIGKTITNENFIVLSGKEKKIATYASTSLDVDINTKGIATLINGNAKVLFDKNFSSLLSTKKPIIVTVTPVGESNGLYLVSVDSNGFTIKENNHGKSNVLFNWIAVGERAGFEKPEISEQILNENFEQNLTEVMHDETVDGGKAIWSENGNVKFGDKAPYQTIKETLGKDIKKLARDKTKKE